MRKRFLVKVAACRVAVVVQVLQFDLTPCGSLEDEMLAKFMVSLVIVVTVRVKGIEIEKVIKYFEDGGGVSIKRFHLHNCVPVVVTRVTHHPDTVRKENLKQ